MKNNKRILWIVTELFPPDETSTAYILGEIANAMVKKYQVKIICGPEIYDKRKKLDENNKFKLDPLIETFRAKGLNIDKNTKFGKAVGLLLITFRLIKLVKSKVKKGDKVLLVTNPLPLIVLMARLKSKICFELNILVHDIFPENAKPSNIKIPCEPFVKKIFNQAYAKADMLIALGRDMADVLIQKNQGYKRPNGSSPKVVIIENWADIVDIYPIQRSLDSNIVIEYAGNIGRGQGLQSFLDNFVKAGNPLLTFDLYGTGASELALQTQVSENNIKNVRFHGAYFRSQQNDVLNACNLALVTLADGMYGLGVPSKSYNIMAAGKAILFIGDLRSEIALMVRENNIGVCFGSEDIVGLISYLKSINSDTLVQYQEMGMRARELAKNKYSKDSILKKFQNML